MRPLDLAGDEAPSPAILKPDVKGRWQWVGTNALLFVPDVRLPRATDFTVTVPAGTRALDGSTLAKPYELTFSTARPAIARIEPGSRSEDLKPDTRFLIRFNQPVDETNVAAALNLSVGETPVNFKLRRPDPKNEMLLELAPTKPLPLDSDIRLTARKLLRGTEGPLPSARDQLFEFRTYGPLFVEKTSCDDNNTPHRACDVRGGVSLELSNNVKLGDLKKAVTIEPAVKLAWPSWMSDDDLTSDASLFGRFSPGKRYRLRVSAKELKDEHGQRLERDFVREVAFDDYSPTAEIGLTGSIFEPAAKRDIPIALLNVTEAELVAAPLTPDDVLRFEEDSNHPGSPPELNELAAFAGAKKIRIRPTAAANTPFTHLLRTEDALGGSDRRGPIAVALRFTEQPGTADERPATRTTIAQVTDLAVSAKVSAHGSIVWVTRLSTAAPVSGAEVSIRRPDSAAQAAVFRTDAAGIVNIPSSAFMPAKSERERGVIFARAGNDWSYRRVEDAIGGWRFNVLYGAGSDHPFGMLFTDRGIYRPGDTVHIKGIFREEAHPGTKTPAGKTVTVIVDGPGGEQVVKLTPRLSEYGTFSSDVTVPSTLRLGTFNIRATVEGSPSSWADVTEEFEVAEYKTAEFQVSAESDKPSYVRGDKFACVARGDYLFGAPMPNADVRLSVRRAVTAFEPPGIGDDGFTTSDYPYTFDLPDQQPSQEEIATTRGKLDAKGSARIEAGLAMPGQRGAELVTCEADVTDISRQALSGSTSAIVHPADFYVALKAGADLFVKAGDTVKPEILAVDPKGGRVRGAAVRVELIQRTWTTARQKTGGGALHTVTTTVDKVVGSCAVTTSDKAEACAITPPSAGYFVVRATAADTRGNKVASSASLYALGDTGVVGFRDSDRMQIDLVTDKKSYEVGEKARVLVKSPFKTAEAWVTVERGGVFTKRTMTLSGPTPTIEVPITEDLRPNAFVSVLIVRGRSKAAPAAAKGGRQADVGAPTFRMGYASLQVNPESRRLKVTIAPNKSDYKPGEPVKVGVDVRDPKGRPAKAEVTLYAVDEGVLSLIGYETPDPIPVFGAPRPLKVETIETREALAKVLNPFAALGVDKGSDGGGGGSSPEFRRDFRASAYYNPTLITDAKGHAEATFKLPDSLTTYRVMAVTAAADDRFGYAQTRVTASRPLMARPAFPRVIRAGDALEAGIVVSSKGLAKSDVDVEIAAEGLTIGGSTKRTVALEAGASEEVRFPITAPRVGKAKVRFRIKGGGAEDAVEIARDVVPPMSPEAVALYGDTGDQSAEKLGDLSALRPDVGGLELSLASTALVGLGGAVEQLVDYPYLCVEQLVSRLVPLLPLRDLARDFKIALPASTDRIVETSVAKILAAQRPDGGFGLWSESPQANPWVTAYALWGLSEAKKRGVRVPARAITSATRYVRESLEEMDRDTYARATAPFILYVLADTGAADPGRASRLFESRRTLPLFSKALLLHAMVVGKSDRRMIDELVPELEGALRLDGPKARAVANMGSEYAVLMDSETRTSALVLRALLAARPSHPMASKLVMGLLGDRKGGAWRSTQETAWSLLALDDYRRTQEKAAPDFTAHVFLGQAEIFTAKFEGRDVGQARKTLQAGALAQAGGSALAFDVDGKGRLFYEARLRYARKELPSKPLDRGFFIKKTLRAVTQESLEEALRVVPDAGASSFAGGGLVLADIVVVTPSPREFVVIDDPLPAGLEAVNMRLATTSRGLDVDAQDEDEDDEGDEDEEVEDKRAKGRAYNPSSFIRELRDDRVLFFVDHMAAGMYRYRYLARATTLGTFVLPPTRAEEMYTPEVFGRTAAGSVAVTAKK
jgi:uncharacterized protein YfaS (alpha-2-macroglobulin family)